MLKSKVLVAQLEKFGLEDPHPGIKATETSEEDSFAHVTANDCPSLGMFVHVARKLIYPDPSYEDAPRLLELFVHIEAIRQRAVDHARVALKLHHKFIDSQELGSTVLKKMDERKLTSIADENLETSLCLILREDVMQNLCRLHIRYLWTSEESHMIMRSMKRYFPSNYSREGDAFADEHWKDIIHFGLTVEERKRVHSVGEEMKSFLLEAREWDLEREKYFNSLGVDDDVAFGDNEFISYPRDFNAKFRAVADERRMLESVKMYLKNVEDSVNTLERIFPTTRREVESAEALLERRAETFER